MLYFDFFRFFYVRFLFSHKQFFGLGFFLHKQQKKKMKDYLNSFKIYFNDLTFRVNNLMESLLNRNNFIYFFENVDLFYNFIFNFFNSKNMIIFFFTFFGFFLINYKKFIKNYKFFVFYTVII